MKRKIRGLDAAYLYPDSRLSLLTWLQFPHNGKSNYFKMRIYAYKLAYANMCPLFRIQEENVSGHPSWRGDSLGTDLFTLGPFWAETPSSSSSSFKHDARKTRHIVLCQHPPDHGPFLNICSKNQTKTVNTCFVLWFCLQSKEITLKYLSVCHTGR